MPRDFNLDAFRVDESLVAAQLQVSTAADVIEHLAEMFVRQGYVKPSYAAAAIEREKTSPTGLPTPGVGTAIPHAGTEHTLKPGIAIGTLATPVQFGELGDPDSLIDVSVVFLLSVTEPEAQVHLLRSIMEVYKDATLLLRLQQATDPRIVVEEVNAALESAQSASG